MGKGKRKEETSIEHPKGSRRWGPSKTAGREYPPITDPTDQRRSASLELGATSWPNNQVNHRGVVPAWETIEPLQDAWSIPTTLACWMMPTANFLFVQQSQMPAFWVNFAYRTGLLARCCSTVPSPCMHTISSTTHTKKTVHCGNG